MIIKLKNSHVLSIKNKFLSVKTLANSCRAWTSEEKDYFLSKINSEKSNINYLENINIIVKNNFKEIKTLGNMVLFRYSSKFSNQLMDKIRRAYVNVRFDCSRSNINLPFINISYNPSPENQKQVSPLYQDNLIINKRQLLSAIIGLETFSQIKNTEKYKKYYSGKSLQFLFFQKKKIIENISKHLTNSGPNFDFKYTKDEMKSLKRLAEKYDAITSLFNDNNISTMHIENLLFDTSNISSIGGSLSNHDIILKKTKIFDKKLEQDISALLCFANTQKGYRFKLYKSIDDLLIDKQKYAKQFYHLLRTNNVKGINSLNKKIAAGLVNTEIAEVYVDINNRESMCNMMQKELDLSSEDINYHLGNDDSFYYIHDLQNFCRDRYYNVSHILIKCLKQFGLKNNVKLAFMEAFSFGKIKHSPIALYLRAGCIPISETKDNIEHEIRTKQNGFDYRRNIWLKYNIYK